jgi:ferritin-like protein
MADSSARLHEPAESLRPETIDAHRATVSLMEELEAADWYGQRIEAAQDRELAMILRHNRNEELEHASMALEWLRRRDPVLDAYLRRHLFQPGPIVSEQELAESAGQEEGGSSSGGAAGDGSLGIGSLRGSPPR